MTSSYDVKIDVMRSGPATKGNNRSDVVARDDQDCLLSGHSLVTDSVLGYMNIGYSVNW